MDILIIDDDHALRGTLERALERVGYTVTATDCGLATGIWQPETALIKKIRTHIVNNPKAWKNLVPMISAAVAICGQSMTSNFTK